MSDVRNVIAGTAAIAAVALVISASLSSIAPASARNTADIAAAPGDSVALYITLCLWSPHRPAPACRDVTLTPGAAGPRFASMKACQDGQEDALRRWRAEAGPVFGFTAMAGDGYRIEAIRCSPVSGSSSGGS
jgi:hypothetical protein